MVVLHQQLGLLDVRSATPYVLPDRTFFVFGMTTPFRPLHMLRRDLQDILAHLLVTDMRMLLEILRSSTAWKGVSHAAFDNTIFEQ